VHLTAVGASVSLDIRAVLANIVLEGPTNSDVAFHLCVGRRNPYRFDVYDKCEFNAHALCCDFKAGTLSCCLTY
jgi:hypothetical protein